MSKDDWLCLLLGLFFLLVICGETTIAVTPETIISVYLDCPGILNDLWVCRDCRLEDAWGEAPENCKLVEIEE